MKIGIVGYGFVGSAVGIGLADIGNDVYYYDINKDISDDIVNAESARDVWTVRVDDIDYLTSNCDIIFICVPTPQKKDGSCDVSIVEDVVSELTCSCRGYKGSCSSIKS